MTLADWEVGRQSGKWVNGRCECSFPLALFLLVSPPRLSFFMYIRNGKYSTRMQHDHRSMLEKWGTQRRNVWIIDFDKGKLSGSARSSCLHGRRNQSRRIIRFRWKLSWRLRNELWTGPRQSDLHVAKHLPHTHRSLRDIVVIYFTTWYEICSSRNIIEKLHLSTEKCLFPVDQVLSRFCAHLLQDCCVWKTR